MNPQTWPQWLKLTIGGILLAGNGVLPWLEGQSLSPGAHAAISTAAMLWLFLVNTWNSASGSSVPKPPPLAVFVVAICAVAMLIGCTPAASPDGGAPSDAGNPVIQGVVTIANTTCQVLESDPNLPEWVQLACAAEGVVGGIVKVLVPRKQWLAMQAVDAGAGR